MHVPALCVATQCIFKERPLSLSQLYSWNPRGLSLCSTPNLVLGLDLVVASNNLGVGWRDALVIGASLAGIRDAMLLRRRSRVRGGGGALGAVIHALRRLRLGLLGVLALRALDVDVGDAATFAILGERLVLVGRLGVLGDDVPRVKQAGDEAEHAEEDVDEGVGATDATLDPDCATGLAVISTGR